MSLISAKGYENAGVSHLIIKKVVNYCRYKRCWRWIRC